MTKNSLHEVLARKYPGAFEADIGAARAAIVTIIHDSFEGKPRTERIAEIEKLILACDLVPAIIEAYTPGEAQELGVSISTTSFDAAPATWEGALEAISLGKKPASIRRPRKMRKIVFYSYKGGVGRTTAVVHTAFLLARQGKRVAVVDMDLEAPGVHAVVPPPDGSPVTLGVVDYLWERQVKPTAVSYQAALVRSNRSQKAISYVVEDPAFRAQVNIVPAGVPSADYISKMQSLSMQELQSGADDAWAQFEDELEAQIDPDFVLIDARTGLGDWGGLSLLRLADEVFLVMFPSAQNAEGIHFVKEVISSARGIRPRLIFSPVPEGQIGQQVVARAIPLVQDDDEQLPVCVYYSLGLAGASGLPVESAISAYQEISDAILEREKEALVEGALATTDRWQVLRSLTFPERDARSIVASDFETYFQKTSDFDKFLDDARWVVRGRKGTGKSTLFHLFVEHRENAAKRAKGKLDGIDIVAGHGPTPSAQFRPTTDEFLAVNKSIKEGGFDWLSFWRAYAIVRLWVSRYVFLDTALSTPEMTPLKNFLRSKFSQEHGSSSLWRSKHTAACISLVEGKFAGLCRDAFSDLNAQLAANNQKLWLLYDDLDQDIKEDSEWQGEALGGLLRLAYDSNNRDLHNIRLKVFLREDIWSKLVFTNKSHFGEPRTVLLQWRIEDFLRLAYRLAVGGSAEFRALASKEQPIVDEQVDYATEEELQRALAPLWGLSQEKGKKTAAAKWVYSRLTDARENTYPRSLTVMLNAAKAEELQLNSRAPPPDRLLSPVAMQAGLKSASVERVNALKNEYPTLKQFLEDVENRASLRSQFTSKDLNEVWERTSIQLFPSFEAFVANLEESGLLVKKRGTIYEYGFASLYIDGLGVTRVQGEKK